MAVLPVKLIHNLIKSFKYHQHGYFFHQNRGEMKLAGCLVGLVVALGCYHVHAGSVGVNLGFGGSSRPYGEALQHLKDRGVRFIKTFSINPDWLNEVEAVYAGVIMPVFYILFFDTNKTMNFLSKG